MAARLRPTGDEPMTRLKQASLWSPTRLAILDAVHARPGASMSELARMIGKHQSTIWTNMHLLTSAGVVRVARDGRCVRAFPASGLTERERFLARLGEGACVYEAIERGVPGRPVPIAHALGMTRHAARSHLNRLARLGVLRRVQVRVLTTQVRFIAPANR